MPDARTRTRTRTLVLALALALALALLVALALASASPHARAPARPRAMALSQVPRIQEDAELTVAHESTATCVLLQIGSKACRLCPPFYEALRELDSEFQFDWRYCAADEDNNIIEERGITKLPALVLCVRGQDAIVRQACDTDELRALVRGRCTPKLSLDADF